MACVEDDAHADTVCTLDGATTIDDPGDSAEKYWVEEAATGDYSTAVNEVLGFDTTADYVDVECDANTPWNRW